MNSPFSSNSSYTSQLTQLAYIPVLYNIRLENFIEHITRTPYSFGEFPTIQYVYIPWYTSIHHIGIHLYMVYIYISYNVVSSYMKLILENVSVAILANFSFLMLEMHDVQEQKFT